MHILCIFPVSETNSQTSVNHYFHSSTTSVYTNVALRYRKISCGQMGEVQWESTVFLESLTHNDRAVL